MLLLNDGQRLVRNGLGLGRTATASGRYKRRSRRSSRVSRRRERSVRSGRTWDLVRLLHHLQVARVLEALEMVSQQGRVSGWEARVDLLDVLGYSSPARPVPLLQRRDSCVYHLSIRRMIE